MIPDYSDVAMWAVDLLRAARQQPLWARILLRFALGRFAYLEWVGLMDALSEHGMSPYECYCLEEAAYLTRLPPAPFDWGKERKPIEKV